MKILVDVDGVLADIHPVWLEMYNAEYNDKLRVCDIVKWEMHELVKPECGKAIYKYLKDPALYERALVFPGAQEGMKALREIGEVYFVSAGFFMSKIDWLWENGFIEGDRYFSKEVILCADKQMIKGDILIDDYPPNLYGYSYFNGLLFDHPWNRNEQGFMRVRDWKKITDLAFVESIKISA